MDAQELVLALRVRLGDFPERAVAGHDVGGDAFGLCDAQAMGAEHLESLERHTLEHVAGGRSRSPAAGACPSARCGPFAARRRALPHDEGISAARGAPARLRPRQPILIRRQQDPRLPLPLHD